MGTHLKMEREMSYAPEGRRAQQQHCTGGNLLAHWRALTRPGCTPVTRCQCTAGAAPSVCSRSGCSGRLSRRQRRGGRAGAETRRWLLLLRDALCIVGQDSGWSDSRQGAGREERRDRTCTAVTCPQHPQTTMSHWD